MIALIASSVAAAQYDLNGDGIHELIRVKLDENKLKWSVEQLETGEISDLGYFGVSGDYPLVGVWEKDHLPMPAVLRRSEDGYTLVQQGGVTSQTIPFNSPNERALYFSGDLSGDQQFDLAFVTLHGSKFKWTIFEAPFAYLSERVRRKVIFGSVRPKLSDS